MIKPEWGTKRTCPKCGTRFYDLGQDDPATCIDPECGEQWTPEPVLKSKQPLPFEESAKKEKSGGDDDDSGGDDDDLDIDIEDDGDSPDAEVDLDTGDDDLGVSKAKGEDDEDDS